MSNEDRGSSLGCFSNVLFILVWYKGVVQEDSRVAKVENSHRYTLLGNYLWDEFGLNSNSINRTHPPSYYFANSRTICEFTLNSREHFMLGNLY